MVAYDRRSRISGLKNTATVLRITVNIKIHFLVRWHWHILITYDLNVIACCTMQVRWFENSSCDLKMRAWLGEFIRATNVVWFSMFLVNLRLLTGRDLSPAWLSGHLGKKMGELERPLLRCGGLCWPKMIDGHERSGKVYNFQSGRTTFAFSIAHWRSAFMIVMSIKYECRVSSAIYGCTKMSSSTG